MRNLKGKLSQGSFIFLCCMLLSCVSDQNGIPEYLEGSYEAEWSSLAAQETPEWFEDAVLGFYFH